MTITESQLTDSATAPAGSSKKGDGPAIAPVRTRRSGIWIAAATALVLAGAVTGVFIYTGASNATQVFVASTDIPRGSVIDKEDLTTISIAAGQTTSAVPVSDVDTLLGTVAAVDIPAGGLVTEASVANGLAVPKGKALVGLTLTPAQMPAQQLFAGDNVILVPIPAQGIVAPVDASAAETISATVSQVRAIEGTNDMVVDVYVTSQTAPSVAAQAAAGTLAIYLIPGEE